MTTSLDAGIKLGVIALSLVWAFGEFRFAARNRRRAEGQAQEKDRGSFVWIAVSIYVGMTVASVCALTGVTGFRHQHRWELSGLMVLLAGLWVRVHAIRTLGRHFTSRVTILQEHSLIRAGLYKYVRHPAYLGEILILVGLGIMLANAAALVAAPLFATVALVVRIVVEEDALVGRFGPEYEAYRRETWRLLPLIW